MSRNYTSPAVMCPFYKSENARLIVCEGPSEGSSIHICFGGVKDKENYKRANCERMRENWKCCVIAQGLLNKYE